MSDKCAPMGIGLCGAHRVGKTTLAKLYADTWRLPYVETDVAGVWRKSGLDLNGEVSFADRMEVQWLILDHLQECYESVGEEFVSDRTPIDVMGYASTYLPINPTAAESAEYKRYIESCFDLVNERFGVIVLVQPGIELVDSGQKGKGALSVGWIEKLNTLMNGFIYDERRKFRGYRIKRSTTDLYDRLRYLSSIGGYDMVHFSENSRQSAIH